MGKRSFIVEPPGAQQLQRLASELSGSELQSVLLEVLRRRARSRNPSEVLAQFQRDGFCRPGLVDQRTSLEVDRELLAAAAAFEAIELSPLTPLGSCSSFALTDQNRVVSALRGTEVVADPTNVLALECALRLRKAPGIPVHFATSQRVVRAQPVPNLPGYAPHYRLFVLASAGQETKDHTFTLETLLLQIRTMLDALERLERAGYGFGARRIDILATEPRAKLGDRVAEALGALASRKLLDHAYYSGGLRYQLWVTTTDGVELPLIDGGAFDWLAKLTSSRRAVFVASGAGAQLIALRFSVANGLPTRASGPR
ncbi:MAG TPA: hypothetical protein VIW29_00730 [Polyangiaceae bacterium]